MRSLGHAILLGLCDDLLFVIANLIVFTTRVGALLLGRTLFIGEGLGIRVDEDITFFVIGAIVAL